MNKEKNGFEYTDEWFDQLDKDGDGEITLTKEDFKSIIMTDLYESERPISQFKRLYKWITTENFGVEFSSINFHFFIGNSPFRKKGDLCDISINIIGEGNKRFYSSTKGGETAIEKAEGYLINCLKNKN